MHQALIAARKTVLRPAAFGLLFAAAFSVWFLLPAPGAEARPTQCFGKPIKRVITGSNKTVRLAFRQVAWVEGENITVIGKPFSVICAGEGSQTIRAGKGISFTDAGPGNDRIYAEKGDSTVYGGPGNDRIVTEKGNRIRVYGGPGNDRIRTGKGNDVRVDGGSGHDRIALNTKTAKGVVYGGLGNDYITGSKSHDRIYAGPKRNRRGLPDRDVVKGMGGNDWIFDYSGNGNRLYGLGGSDRIYSLGNAVSALHGGNGTDFLYSNGGRTRSGVIEKLFGEQGNDRLRADEKPNNGPAYLDGAEGDDWMHGSDRDDILIYHAGIKKLWGNGGDDLFVTSGRGLGKLDGGAGNDTISYAALTTSNTYVAEMGGYISGVKVYLSSSNQGWGYSVGHTRYQLRSMENVIGSSFDDYISGGSGTRRIDGGLGRNMCRNGGEISNCNGNSPGNDRSRVLVDINEGGIPTVMGSRRADTISIGYNRQPSRFEVSVAGGARPSGLCEKANSSGTRINCPVDPNLISNLVVAAGAGNDNIGLRSSIPAYMTTKLNGENGRNTIVGGPSKDLIETSADSAGSVLNGGKGLDIIYANDKVKALGGAGTDIFRVVNPCVGASLSGGGGTDGVVFAGPKNNRGVKASLGDGYARWRHGGCAAPTRIGENIEKLEGTNGDDHLIVGRRHSRQEGRSVIFGREGSDILDARNGRRDTITVGEGGKSGNTVRADKRDKINWGWGLGGY